MTTKIEFGNILVALNRKSVQVFARGRLGRFWPKHLTMHFEPVKGDAGLEFTPHVTDPRVPGQSGRVWLPPVLVDSFTRVMTGFGDDIREAWVARTKQVDLQELEEAEWLVVVAKPESFPSVVKEFQVGKGRYRFRRSIVDKFSNEMLDQLVAPTELQTNPPKSTATVAAMRIVDDQFESASLWYFPHGLNGPPGWYMTPMNWAGENHEVIEEIMVRNFPLAFWKGLWRAMKLVGMPVDEAKVDRLVAKYQSRT